MDFLPLVIPHTGQQRDFEEASLFFDDVRQFLMTCGYLVVSSNKDSEWLITAPNGTTSQLTLFEDDGWELNFSANDPVMVAIYTDCIRFFSGLPTHEIRSRKAQKP
ncbi:hypothetical protein [Limnothrix sp. PR1529]|uniref:hypothetical protein n=1 Tax=Limnothrix sp. PR1529 TaxID=1704291 RepID=UPI00117A3909|nr:hypothetical protein [Limnothrix sp. PR1529]